MTDFKLKKLTIYGLFIALVAVTTMAITVPMVGVQGYVNVGDTMIFITGLLLGPQAGLIAGGIGSALADLLLGYAHWAPWTLVVKGVEGLLVGLIGYHSFKKEKKITFKTVLALVVAALWMVFGYFLAGGFMVGFEAALGSIPGDLIQGGSSILFSLPLAYFLGRNISRIPLLKEFYEQE